MAFLRTRDYLSKIKENDLTVILKQGATAGNTSMTPSEVRLSAERKVIAKVSSMICHRYDVRKIFVDILPYSNTTQFNINDLVEYSEPVYKNTSTYSVDDFVSFKEVIDGVVLDNIYKNTIAITKPETFNKSKWALITANENLYVCKEESLGVKPGTDFTYTTNQFTDNHETILGWDTKKDLFFKRIKGTIKIYYSSADRSSDSNSVGIVQITKQINKFPSNVPIEVGTDTDNCLTGDLSIVGFMPLDQEWSVEATNPFALEDNRYDLMIDIVIDLVLFHIHAAISPRTIPELRGELRNDSMDMLDDIKNGVTTPKLPLFHDESTGQRIDYGSETQIDHTFFRNVSRRPWE